MLPVSPSYFPHGDSMAANFPNQHALLTHRKPTMASDALYHHISLKKGVTIFYCTFLYLLQEGAHNLVNRYDYNVTCNHVHMSFAAREGTLHNSNVLVDNNAEKTVGGVGQRMVQWQRSLDFCVYPK